MRKIFSTAILALFFNQSAFGAIGAPAAPTFYVPSVPVVIRINSPVTVSEENIHLGQIGTIQVTRTKDKDDIVDLQIARMPQDKDSLALPAAYVQARVREVLGAERRVQFDMPEVIELRKSQKHFTQSRFSEELIRLAREGKKIPEDVELRVEANNFPASVDYQPGASIRIEAQNAPGDWHGIMLFKVILADAQQQPLRNFFVQAKLNWLAMRWVSKRDLAFRSSLRAEDFELSAIDVGPGRNPPLLAKTIEDFNKLVDGATANRAVHKGQALVPSWIARDPDVQRGQKIKIVVNNNNGLRVVASGEAMKSAVVGGELRARLSKTGRIVSGLLVEKDLLEVGL